MTACRSLSRGEYRKAVQERGRDEAGPHRSLRGRPRPRRPGDPRSLTRRDESFVLSIKPKLVVRPGSEAEVQALVAWANQTGTPLVPVSSGAPHFYGDTVPSVPGAVMVDLSRMNKILRIDRRNRMVVIEPGVTYAQLQPELAKEGMRVTPPLYPRANKSVIASLLERQPTLVTRYNYSLPEPLRNCGVIWGDGTRFFTGESGMGPADLEATVGGRRPPGGPEGPAADRLLPPAHRRAGHLRHRHLGVGQVRTPGRSEEAALRHRRHARRSRGPHLPARPHPRGR